MTRKILITSLIGALAQIGFAQTNFDKTKLDNYFNVLEKNNKFMGSAFPFQKTETLFTQNQSGLLTLKTT